MLWSCLPRNGSVCVYAQYIKRPRSYGILGLASQSPLPIITGAVFCPRGMGKGRPNDQRLSLTLVVNRKVDRGMFRCTKMAREHQWEISRFIFIVRSLLYTSATPSSPHHENPPESLLCTTITLGQANGTGQQNGVHFPLGFHHDGSALSHLLSGFVFNLYKKHSCHWSKGANIISVILF